MSNHLTKTNEGIISNEIILKQTDKILGSPAFLASGILRRFLTYIVNETLAGNEREIKEYTIAIYVLKKNFVDHHVLNVSVIESQRVPEDLNVFLRDLVGNHVTAVDN